MMIKDKVKSMIGAGKDKLGEPNKSTLDEQSEQSSDVHMNSEGVNVEPVQQCGSGQQGKKCCRDAQEEKKSCCKDKPEVEQGQREGELTEVLQRIQAEFENYRKRVERDQEFMKVQSKKDIVLKLLTVLDNFDLVLKSAPSSEFAKGIELIYAQLMTTLESEGVKVITETNFDPRLHEALLQEESDKKSGSILEVLQKGYTIGDQVIRHAKVKVAK